MTWLGIGGQTLDMTILLAEFISMWVWMTSLLIFIVEVFSISESSIGLLDRKMQYLLFDILET